MAEPCLALDGVSLRFGSSTALDGVSLEVAQSERVALLGPSGAGKSSLLSLVNTSRPPSAGSVRLFGALLDDLTPKELRLVRRRLAVVHQLPVLPGSLRVVHNVNAGRLAHWSTWRSITSLARPRGVQDARNALDQLGVGDKLWSRTDELSGGERQRVALARLALQPADLIVADEPVASLDPARANRVLATLGSTTSATSPGQSPAVLVSLHDVDLARRHFDRVIGLRHGRIHFDARAEDISAAMVEDLYDLTIQS
ncbi:MAG: ATP-binding cassette domain-containing protein [Acidimicrobiales bacterium]